VDSFFSLIPEEFKLMVDEVRKVEKALGKVSYEPTPEALKNMWVRRSLYVSKSIKKGEKLTLGNVKSVRPAFGLHPKNLEKILNRKVNKNLEKGDRLSWDVLE
jgi:sialic acid synthase SpsE